MKKEQRWLLLDTGDIRVVIPEWDIKPHISISDKEAKRLIKKGIEVPIAFSDCPCKPTFELLEDGTILVGHRSFLHLKEIEKSLDRTFNRV